MLLPLIATLAATCAVAYTKWLFMKKKIGYLPYTVQSFWAVLLVLLPGIFFFPLPSPTLFHLLLFFFLILFAGIWNVIFYRGFSEEPLVESQLVVMFVPLLSAFFGFLFFPDERHVAPLLFLVGGVIALLWSHISHHRLRWHHGSLLVLASSFFIAGESVLVKMLLPVFSVYWLYFIRVVAVTIVLTIMFPHAVIPRHRSMVAHLFAIGFLVVVQFIFTYWSFAVYGLVYSNLVLSLVPVFVGLVGVLLFHEPISKKKVIAAAILLLCIILAQFF